PKRAVAYKFPAQLAATQITSVDIQVGRTGILTPVANFEPVQLSGATLKRVSLHNRDFIKQKDIHINDRIWLQRSGEVIPYIVSVITDRRTGEESMINSPETCPSCHEPVSNRDMHYYCTNSYCPDKIKQQIQHFVSKNCMDIQGIGESIVDILVDNKIIENIADIYKLTDHTVQMQLRRFPGFGDKKVAEITNGVEESKQKALRRLLNGLGISHVGKKMAQDLAKEMINDTLKMIDLVTNQELLRSIYGIGEKSVESISTFFQDKDNIKLLKQLEAYGVNMDPKKYTDHIRTDEVKGSFSITGSFDVSRKTITEYFQRNGYIFNESPTKTTDFILIGEKASSKKDKAQELGIQIYEGWDTIVKQFPFLKHMSTEVKKKPTTQSLF
ncbi:MAG TPA: helix-hairpin-helix domain-containing protein, partial [Candidatus Absconditabacterales bacterium]|nr:helix-hairpin-helix domain-containing protein [Candidatus Absconditabacterales bacterium]